MLHLLSHSPSDPKFELCVKNMLAPTASLNAVTSNNIKTTAETAVKPTSHLVLYQDAVYVLANGYQHTGFYSLVREGKNISATVEASSGSSIGISNSNSNSSSSSSRVAIYALVDDLTLRGVKLNANQPITPISYAELVELTLTNHPVLNW